MTKQHIAFKIHEKFQQWVNTIDNSQLRHSLESGAILAGGAIASLLTGKPVNDYDFYFRNQELVDGVQEYYNGRRHQKDDPPNVYMPVYITPNAITLSDDVQLITRFCGEPEQVLKTFDFAHCTNYWCSWDDTVVTNHNALLSICSKTLIYSGSHYPLASLCRLRKFLSKGWTIHAGQLLKMAMQIHRLNMEDPAVLQDQLVGVDASYFHDLIEQLKDPTSNTVDYTLVAELVDQEVLGTDFTGQ